MRNRDTRYEEYENLWSGRPNGALTVEVDGLEPGQALDVGCGEGGDALWLAAAGWHVTAVDISEASAHCINNLVLRARRFR